MFERLISIAVIVIIGAFSRKWHKIDSSSLTKITLDIFMPPLIFISIIDAEIDSSLILHPALSCSVVILGTLLFLKIISMASNKDYMRYSMPIAFMNSGFLAFPVAESLGGIKWLGPAIIYDQMMNFIIFTIGISIVNKGVSFSKRIVLFLHNPVLLAILIAAIWKISGTGLPHSIRSIITLPANACIPLALFSVGAALAELKSASFKKIYPAVIGRYLLGGSLAILYCFVTGIHGYVAEIIILSSTMPSAVLSFLLPARYGLEADYAAGVVLFSTIAYPLILPAIIKIMSFFA